MRVTSFVVGLSITAVTVLATVVGLIFLPLSVSNATGAIDGGTLIVSAILPAGIGLLVTAVARGAVDGFLGRGRRLLASWRQSPRRWRTLLKAIPAVLFASLISALIVLGLSLVAIQTWTTLGATVYAFGGKYRISTDKLLHVDSPRVTDKAVVVTENGRLHGLTFSLDDRIRAKRPSDVGTVIRLREGSFQVGTYVSKSGNKRSDARKRYIDVDVVDLSLGAIVVSKTFFGSDPPPSVEDGILGASDAAGGDPKLDEILTFIKGLRRTTPHLSRAYSLRNQGQYEQAVREFDTAIRSADPSFGPEAYMGMAKALVQDRRCGEAVTRLSEGSSRYPDNGLPKIQEAWTYVFCDELPERRPAQAIKIAQAVMTRWTYLRIAEVTEIVAEASFQLGDIHNAIKYGEETVALDKKLNDGSLREHYRASLDRYRNRQSIKVSDPLQK